MASNLVPTIKYIWLTIKHKCFVLYAGLRWTKAPLWRLVIHDWSKFTPSEAPHYGRQFFGDKSDPEGFVKAWIHHQNHNPHHWEYWIPRTGHNRCTPPYPDNVPVAMPEWAVREMVADWLGASRAYEGRWPSPAGWPWMDNNLSSVLQRCHGATAEKVLSVLAEVWRNMGGTGYRGGKL